MKYWVALLIAGLVVVGLTGSALAKGEVLLYTGTFQWIDQAMVDDESVKCADLLTAGGQQNETTTEGNRVAEWMQATTGDGGVDVLILYGDIPPEVYTNDTPDGSIAETWIESEDGDLIINHADYMFWGLGGRNEVSGLQNMMDIPDITMWDDDTPMVVTADGKKYTPSLVDFNSDRPFHLDELTGDWVPEVIFAQNAAGNRADPVIVKDGARGRLAPIHQTATEDNPKAEVAAEIILNYLPAAADDPATAVEPQNKLATTWAALKR